MMSSMVLAMTKVSFGVSAKACGANDKMTPANNAYLNCFNIYNSL